MPNGKHCDRQTRKHATTCISDVLMPNESGKKPCKGTKIDKNQLRLGTWVVIRDRGAFKWRHWGCEYCRYHSCRSDSYNV